MEKNIKYLADIYEISMTEMEKIEADNGLIVALTHILHEKEYVKFAGLFGSRVSERPANSDSDLDIAVILDSYSENKINDLSFEIRRRIHRRFEFDIDLDIISMNREVNHGEKLDDKGSAFRDTVKSNIFVIKGKKSDLP